VIVAAVALVVHLLLITLGFAFLLSADALGRGLDLGTAPTWYAIAFALPLAMLAYTGLETVANLASETREPGRTLPRSLFAGIGLTVVVSVAIAAIGLSAYPSHRDADGPGGFASGLGEQWLRAPLVGIAEALDRSLPSALVDVITVLTGVSGAAVLVAAVTTSISGAGRLAYSLGQYEMLPRAFARLNRRTLLPPVAIVSTAAVSCAFLVATVVVADREVRSLASLYSFGVLLTFTSAQVAVVRLRFTQPELPRPFRVPGNITVRGTPIPVAALVGAPLTLAIWIAALATHPAARIVGPVWLVVGAGVYLLSRRYGREPVLGRVTPPVGQLDPAEEGAWERILVPLKIGAIGEEVLATAIRLAEERGSTLSVLHVIRVPLELPLDAPMHEAEERAAASIAEARVLAAEHGVVIEGEIVRARSLGEAIVERAVERDVDLIVMGSAPRWRRQSRFFSPTVDYVLRRADCEVMVIAYPQGVLEEIAEPV
jgi:basic amino acid/polyamine antiporter, APA family